MSGSVTALKGALAHIEQGTINAKAPTATAQRIVKGLGVLTAEQLGPESRVGREAIAYMAQAIQDYDHAIAMLEMAAFKIRQGIERAGAL